MKELLLILLLLVVNGFGLSKENTFFITQKQSELFTKILLGSWNGEAIKTPVGQVDYDIHFYKCQNNVFAGVAETGASLHYWYFREENNNLSLKFLSTFAGNRQPVFLVPEKKEGDIMYFTAPELALLTVSIEYTDDQIEIRIFHHRKPHVHIRLKRTDRHEISNKQQATFCQNLPKLLIK